ncbi:hypothetical protein [Ruminococcus flavefaciens]|uniref:hypothetical protein n=1 Tax=Ruminococcus flavefaciens TaxID=1265 RepID=UPI0004671CDC|nr:hypothetical protein [Ruminococcus flavefaciens]
MWNLYNDRINWSIYSSYAWIPHRYAIGDIVVYDKEIPLFDTNGDNPLYYSFAVVVENNSIPLTTTGLDINNMAVRCAIFEKNDFHSCGGVFIQRDFAILRIESCKESETDECPKALIRFSHLIKRGISVAEFLEEYSNGKIN